jgi:hypothetical protein
LEVVRKFDRCCTQRFLHYLAIEAGKSLTGKVIIQVEEDLDPTALTLEVNGKEKTVAYDDASGKQM